MNLNTDYMIIVFIVIFLFLIAAKWFLRIRKYGSYKAALFGAPIDATIGEVHGSRVQKSSSLQHVLKVHRLAGEDDRVVGMELISNIAFKSTVYPLTLSRTETEALIRCLQVALKDK